MQFDPSTAKYQILIADDQATVRAALAMLLGSLQGFAVVATTSSCGETLRLAVEWKPDIVLLDVLPEPTIFESAGEIIARCPSTKLLLLDDEPHDFHAQQALRLSAAGYLTKQQTQVQLETALRQAILGHRVFDPQIAQRLIFSPEGVRLGADRGRAIFAELTPREMDVLMHVVRGYSVKQCAKALGISASTVDNHKSRLMKKLRVHKAVELTNLAVREGLLSPMSVPAMSLRTPVAVAAS